MNVILVKPFQQRLFLDSFQFSWSASPISGSSSVCLYNEFFETFSSCSWATTTDAGQNKLRQFAIQDLFDVLRLQKQKIHIRATGRLFELAVANIVNPALNGGVNGFFLLLFSELTAFEDSVSTSLSLIVVSLATVLCFVASPST